MAPYGINTRLYSPMVTRVPLPLADLRQIEKYKVPYGANVMVVGTEKTTKIASLPLLSRYADIFREVISAGDVRLMIAGYGFADEHINAMVAEAIESHGLSVFIWNTASDLKGLVLSSPPYGGKA